MVDKDSCLHHKAVSNMQRAHDAISGAFHLQVNKIELVEWVAAFICACFISIEIGLGIAIGVSVVRALAQQSTLWPNVQSLGACRGTLLSPNIVYT